MLKDVWVNVVIPLVITVEVDNAEESGFPKVEAMWENNKAYFAEKIHNSFEEGMCTLEDQELDEIIEQ